MYTYSEIYSRLNFEVATIIFLKKDGSVRVMLGTRNLHTAELLHGYLGKSLGGHDNRCNINNGNIAVIDLILGEARSFNIDRLVFIEFHGEITNKEDLDRLMDEYMQFKYDYEEKQPMRLNMDMLD